MTDAVTLMKRPMRVIRKGMTLIEAAMVLVILALVIGGVMLLFSNSQTSQRISESISQLGTIQQSVKALYSGQADYNGLTTATVLQNLPAKMVTGGAVRHAFNGNVTIGTVAGADGSASGNFTVTFSAIPRDACQRMGAMDLGRHVMQVTINGSSATPPRSPADVQAVCVASNQMMWTFN